MTAVLSSFFSSALDLSYVAQTVQDNIPGQATLAIHGLGSGASYLREGINSKVTGAKRSIKTNCGLKDVVELGPIGGNVMKVRDCDTEKDFALKRMEMDFSSGFLHFEDIKAQEERGKLLPALAPSAHLVQCFGSQVENTGKVSAQVMLFELCGESLAETLNRQMLTGAGPLTANEIVGVLDDVAHGLHCLHTASTGSMVHGSVRPEHIFRGEKGGWKLGGYGASKACSGPADAASDIEQLGLLAYELLFGTPLSDQKPSEHANAEDKVAFVIPDKRPKDLIEGRLVFLMHWMLVANPEQRATAKQVGIFTEDLMQSRPQAEFLQELPEEIREGTQDTCDYLILLLLKEALSQVQGSDRRALINRYGEEPVRDPTLFSPEMQTKFLTVAEQLDRAKELRTIFGSEDAVVLPRKREAKEAKNEEVVEKAPQDLLDFSNDPMIELEDDSSKQKPAEQSTVEMFDLL